MSDRAPGRLFWKFLIFFFLAQTTAVLGIGLAIWAAAPDPFHRPPPPITEGHVFHPGRPALGATVHQPPPAFSPPPPPEAPLPLVHLLTGAVVSLVFAALLAAYVSLPVRRLRQALQAAAEGQFVLNLSASMGDRRDELADLGQDFDRMAQHLARLMEGQRRLLHDVSHELRSPLTRLNAVVDLARQKPERAEEFLGLVERETEKMDRLLEELLTLSRLESGMVAYGKECVDLAELLQDVIADTRLEAELADCQVELKVDGGAEVRGNPEMLHRMFDNLLRNALIHAAIGKKVWITLSSANDTACIRVEDAGPGVPVSEVEKLFVPFYRGSQTHTLTRKGYGLGLAIVRQIVDNHRGTIRATNRSEGGFCVIVTLPCCLEAKAPD